MWPKIFPLFAISSLSSAAGPASWQTLETPEFTLFTQAGARDAQEAIRSLRQIRHILLQTIGKDVDLHRPVQIFIFQSGDEFAKFRPIQLKTVAGFFSPGRDRDYMAMLTPAPNAQQVLFHEFVHLFLYRSRAQLPFWFNEGMADLYSTARIAASGIRIGGPLPDHIACLRREEWPDLGLLFKAGLRSDQYSGARQAQVFYAQSWALVHMLSLDPRYSPRLSEFLALLKKGSRHDEAFPGAFGKSVTEVSNDLRVYIRQSRWPDRIVAAAPFEQTGKSELRPAGSDEVSVALAGLASMGRMDASAYPQSAASAAPSPTPRSTSHVPSGWDNRKGDRRIEGTFLELDCHATAARFIIRTEAGTIALEVDDPSQVVLGNASGTSAVLACGVQTPRKVVVEYDTKGQITALTFK